jgi:phage shock protein C
MKRIYRSQEDKKIAGILGGLGELFDIDPTLLRLLFVFIGLATGVIPLIVAYLIGWVIIPGGKNPEHKK